DRSRTAPGGPAGTGLEGTQGVKALREMVVRWWRVLGSPSRHFSLGLLVIGGFIGGILFWGGFNTALEATNTETFCVSCHEMRDNVFAELKSTIHYSN